MKLTTKLKNLALTVPGILGVLGVLGVLAVLSANIVLARELATDPQDMIPMEVATIGINPLVGAPVVLLRDGETGDIVPIFIGENEARAILLAMRDVRMPRPMTHDLLASMLSSLNATLRRVMVDDLEDGTFYGMLELEVSGYDAPVLVDTRPSDGLALAVRTGAQILVARSVINAAQGMEWEGLGSDQVVSALGITVVEATPDYRDALDLPDEPGLLVWRSTGLAAAEGLTAGSMILEVNGTAPREPLDFLELIRATREGEPVLIRYWRDGEEFEVQLPRSLGVGPAQPEIQV